MQKKCSRCGYPFVGDGMLCKGCSNGHGTDRSERPDITEFLDEYFGYTPPPEEKDDDES